MNDESGKKVESKSKRDRFKMNVNKIGINDLARPFIAFGLSFLFAVVFIFYLGSPTMSPLSHIHDADEDGYPDLYDAFPKNASEWKDSDRDGYGDNSDMLPYDSRDWIDNDGDGVGENTDLFPNDPNNWGNITFDLRFNQQWHNYEPDFTTVYISQIRGTSVELSLNQLFVEFKKADGTIELQLTQLVSMNKDVWYNGVEFRDDPPLGILNSGTLLTADSFLLNNSVYHDGSIIKITDGGSYTYVEMEIEVREYSN